MTVRMLHLRVVAGTGGGPEKTILNSPRFIRKHGYDAEVVYLCPPGERVAESLKQRAVAAECPLTILEDKGPLDWRVVRDIVRLCRKHKIELLQTHDYKSNAIGLVVRRFHRCALATMLHGWTDMSGRMPLYKRVDQWCLPKYESLICVSQDLVDECRRLKIPDRKVHLVHNAIDTKQFARNLNKEAAKAKMGARPDRFLVGTVGRLSPEKGIVQLIETIERLHRNSLAIDLWIAGDGPQREELEARIRALGMEDSVRLLGQLEDTKLFYQAMDLFVLNSIREGLPNVVLEAMAMETPVIATRIAGIPSLVRPGETGRLIAADAPAELERSIGEAISEKDLTQSLVAGARKRIENEYAFDVRMQRVAGIYDRMLKRN